MKVYIYHLDANDGYSFWYIVKYFPPRRGGEYPAVDGPRQEYLHRSGEWEMSTGPEKFGGGRFKELEEAIEFAKGFGYEPVVNPPLRQLRVTTNSHDDGTYCVMLNGLTKEQIGGLYRALNSHRVSHELDADIRAQFLDSLLFWKELRDVLGL